MIKHNMLFIGFDTHKISTEVAHIEDQRSAKPVHYGKVKTTRRHCILFMKQARVAIGFTDC